MITKAMTVWIKFILFINGTWEKRIFKAFSSTKKYIESVGVCVCVCEREFLICRSNL